MTPVEHSRGGGGRRTPVDPIEIEGFTLLGVLGMGAMGVVYDGLQHDPRRPVAIKVMRLMVDAPQVDRVRQEAMIASRCAHPGIVRILSSGVVKGPIIEVPWIAMERVENAEPIDRWFQRRAPSRTASLTLFEGVADALQHAHVQGVIHRDIKPGNILMNAADRPTIIDFGLSSVNGRPSMTEPGMLVGTLRTLAPEVIAGARADVRSDIFSLAVCMHECLAGEWPFGTVPEHVGSMAQAIEQGARSYARRPCARISGDLRLVLSKALDPGPERRYQSMDEFRRDLKAVREGRPVSACPPSLAYRIRRWSGRNPLAASLVACMLVLAAVSAWGMVRLARAAAADYQRANHFVETWIDFMARKPIQGLPQDITIRQLTEQFAVVHHYDVRYAPPSRSQITRAMVLARAYLELDAISEANWMMMESRRLADLCTGIGDSDMFELDLLELMIRGATDPDSPEVHAFADRLFERSADQSPWRRDNAEEMIMLYASGPAAWQCLERTVMHHGPASAVFVAVALPRMARFKEATPERLVWASQAVAQALKRTHGPGVPMVLSALRQGMDGLRDQGHEEPARILEETIRILEAGDA
jgi:hypothetical protein